MPVLQLRTNLRICAGAQIDRFSDRLTQCPKSVDELCARTDGFKRSTGNTGISLAGRHRDAALQQHHRALEMAKVKAQSAAAVSAEAGVTTPAEVPVSASQMWSKLRQLIEFIC